MSMLENPTLFEKWEFQNAEGIETYPKRKMLEIAFNDGIKVGREELEPTLKKLRMCANCAKWNTDELNDQNEPCKSKDCDTCCSRWVLWEG